MNPSDDTAAADRILNAFPGSAIVAHADPPLDPRKPPRHCRLLWGDQQGWAYLGWATGPHWDNGTYKHSSWRPRFFRWPAQAEQLGETAVTMAHTGDVYVGPLLRATRRAASLLPGRFCWVDIDGDWTDEHQTWLDRLGGTTFSVHSGRGRHLYVKLDRLVDPERISELNQQLRQAFAGDHKWHPASMLRLGGTWSWKTVPPAAVHRIR